MIKIEEKIQKIYLTYYNLLTTQDLWKTHYQSTFVKNFSAGIHKIEFKRTR